MVLNRDHKLPRHHPERVMMDVIYWFELVVQVPLAAWILALYFARSEQRHVLEVFVCGMHVGGLVAYYIPDLVLGEHTSIITWLDRCIACCWIAVPTMLLSRALTLSSSVMAP